MSCEHKTGKVVDVDFSAGSPDRITMECECGALVAFAGVHMTGVEEHYRNNDIGITKTLLNMKGGE